MAKKPRAMTSEAWESSKDFRLLLQYLKRNAEHRPTDRKLRLLAAACCRLLWDDLSEPNRRVVEALEGWADGLVADAEIPNWCGRIDHTAWGIFDRAHFAANAVSVAMRRYPLAAAEGVYSQVNYAEGFRVPGPERPRDAAAQLRAAMRARLKDIIRNPFCPACAANGGQSDRVLALADAIYQDRAFDRLPILADALEEAGCTDAEILNHCRQPGEHWRGCWVVDLILGKQ
jgi:hypothetical protein